MTIEELIKNIDSVNIECDIQKLNKKIELLNYGLSMLQENSDYEIAKKMLWRVIYFGFELGSSKAFELVSGDLYKPLILKTIPLAREVFKNKQELLPFLKDYLTYETDLNLKTNIENEINEIEHG